MDNRFGYWFSASDILPNSDGRKIVLGESLKVEGELELCRNGLHYSIHPFDALKYAKGFNLYKVKALEKILTDDDKCCTNERLHIDVRDSKEIVILFARNQAKKVLHLWKAPKIVVDFLNTGNAKLAAEAARAAWAAEAVRAVWAAEAAAAWAAAEAAETVRTAWAARAACAARAAACADVKDTNHTSDYKKEFADMVNNLFGDI